MGNLTKSNGYIGITEHRLHHILSVANKAYDIAKREGYPEEFCRKMFLTGWLHDIGYAFSTERLNHPYEGAALLEAAFGPEIKSSPVYQAIRDHGHCQEEGTDEWRILNMADMTTDSEGRDVDVETRLKGIGERYGYDSDTYIRACRVSKAVGL